MTKCRKVFLDIDGNPSKLYYDTERTKGSVAAEKAYIEYMMGLDPRFSKEGSKKTDVDQLLQKSKELKITADETQYMDKFRNMFSRITSVVAKYKQKKNSTDNGLIQVAEFDPEKISMDVATTQQETAILEKEFGGKIPSDPFLLKRAIREFRNENPDDLIHRAQKIRNSWEASAKWGDHFHMVFQKYFEEVNKIKAVDLDARINDGSILAKVKKNMGKKFLSGVGFDEYKSIVKAVMTEIKSIEKDLGPVRILPELKLSSKKLGFAGTADLVLVNEKGQVVILDFKSKTQNSKNNFDASHNAVFGGIFAKEGLKASPANSARVQMSHYAAILAEEGYSISARDGVRTVVLVGDIFPTDAAADHNSDWGFKNIKVDEIRRNSSLHRYLTKEATSDEETERLRAEGTYGFIDKVGNAEEDSGFSTVENVAYVKEREDAAIKRKIESFNRDNNDKKFIWRNNPSLPKLTKIYIDEHSEEDLDKTLREDYRAMKKDQLTLHNKVVEFFNNNGEEGKHDLGSRSDAASLLLKGINKETHWLMRADQYDSELFSDLGDDVLIAENRKTGGISFISVVNTENHKIRFEKDGSKKRRTYIFGKYATDAAIDSSGSNANLLGNNDMHELLSLKLGIAAMKLKASTNKPLLIEEMRVGSILHGNKAPVTTTFITREIAKLSKLVEVMPDSEVPADIKSLITNPKVLKERNYGFAYAEMLRKKIETVPMLANTRNSKEIETNLASRLATLLDGEYVDPKILQDLIDFKNAVIGVKNNSSIETFNLDTDPDIKLIHKVITELAGFNAKTKQVMKNSFNKSMGRTSMTTMDEIRERAQVVYTNAASIVRKDFEDFNLKHRRLLGEFMKESNDSGISSLDKAFKTLMVDPDFKNKNKPEDFMKLKSQNELQGRPAAQAYAKFVLETIDEQYKHIIKDPKELKQYEDGDTWTRGHLPVLHRVQKITDKNTWDSPSSVIRSMKKTGSAMKKKHYDAHMAMDRGYETNESFENQLGMDGVQHSKVRNNIMGINGNNDARPQSDIETNIASIINNMVVTTSESRNMTIVNEIVVSVSSALESEAITPQLKIDVKKTIASLENWRAMVIENKYGDEKGFFVDMLDISGRAMSMLYFGGSVRQAATELFTGVVQGTSAMVANGIRSLGGGGRFKPADFAWGMRAITGVYGVDTESKIFQMLYDCGMVYADAAQLKQKEFANPNKGGLFKSRKMHYLNQLFFNSSVGTTFMAEMHNKGVDDAYSKEERDGEIHWVYDETKDKRFFVYDETKPNFGRLRPPNTTAEKKANALWKAVKLKLREEGAVDENDRMTLPLTAEERTSIKFYATKLYGSFHKDKTLDQENWVFTRALVRYKAWFVQKLANYHTVSDNSVSRGEFRWIEDESLPEGGIMQWTGLPHEGIIQSIGRAVKEMQEYKKIPNLDEVQKENLSKLLSDSLLLALMMATALPWLEDEEGTSEFLASDLGQSLKKAFINGTSDLNVAATMITMGDTTFPAIDMMGRAFANTWNAFTAMTLGDAQAASRFIMKVPKNFGIYNTVTSIAEAITGPNE